MKKSTSRKIVTPGHFIVILGALDGVENIIYYTRDASDG